jgi:hypothetical protein
VAASTKNEPAVSAKCLEHVLRKIHGCLTTRVLDEGPTAAVGRTTSNRECSANAARRLRAASRRYRRSRHKHRKSAATVRRRERRARLYEERCTGMAAA